MKTLTIKNLSIQIDFNEGQTPVQQAKEAIRQINGVLQREPYGLAPQILNTKIVLKDLEIVENEDAEDFDDSGEL